MNKRRLTMLTSLAVMALAWSFELSRAQVLTLSPGVDYTKPNYAYTGPIRKFVDTLPALNLPGNTLGNGVGQYMPLGVANTPYGTPYGTGCDYYEIGLVEYIERMHQDLPASGTKLRGYVQIVPWTYPGAIPLTPANGCSMNVTNGAGAQMYGLAKPHYLGPLILATKDRAVRIKFMNLLPTGPAGNLFVPADTTAILGAGNGWKQIGTDGNGMPVYEKYTQNRATIHLHGGLPPWISDGTPHQWTVPAGEVTSYKKGASAVSVPDMGPAEDGVITFYWPNQMSGRLMFFHDHAWGLTGPNVYAGEAAGYLVVDPVEESALAAQTPAVPGTIVTAPATGAIVSHDLTHSIPLVIQDKSFVPPLASVQAQDPNWLTDVKDWMTGVAPTEGNLWYPHVYIPNQWPDNPDGSGANPLGRWDWGPWFWPPWPVAPGVTPPTVSHIPESFMDTMLVNGQPYPYISVAPTKYRLRILNASNDRMLNLQLYRATPGIVTNIVLTAGGSGYEPLEPPLVTIAGGGGRGATATAIVDGTVGSPTYGQVTGISLDVVGSGYKTPPTVTIDPPQNAGAQATATAQIYTLPTEVGMVPARLEGAVRFPESWRAQTEPYTPDILDGRVGGVPDPTNRGPAMIQIGTEGGLLPAPVVLRNTPVGYEQNKRNIVVLNVKEKTLFLGPAERADVIVDFSNYPGETILLYNDASAPVPAGDIRWDLFTGNPDNTPSGGAPSTLAGKGPNTRTVLQFRVSGTKSTTPPPTDSYDPNLVTALNTTLANLFTTEQAPPVVSQAAYNGMYAGGGTSNVYSRIQDTSLTFIPYGSTTPVTMQMLPKTIQELFDDVGRLNAYLGTELPFTSAQVQTTVPLNYVDPATEVFNDGETQIWKITHNGVDTHAIHFHLFSVQIINRVGWDGQIYPPDPNELGWKETVRMHPLTDTIVAMRAIKPDLTGVGWSVPKSYRLLNPAVPTNSLSGFSNLDPLTGNQFAPAISNIWTDFGWEYVWHCHLLGHEENDMMRPVVMQVAETAPAAPSGLTATLQTAPVLQANLAWTDNSVNEIGYEIWRSTDGGAFALAGQTGANSTTFSDATIFPAHTYTYKVRAYNSAGFSGFSNTASVTTASGQAQPTGLTATASVLSTAPPTVTLQFTDNSISETGFTIMRATDNLFTQNVTTLPTVAAHPGTGLVTVVDNTVAQFTTYYYQVQANGPPANSQWSNIASVTTVGQLPLAPSNLRVITTSRTSISLSWNDNSTNELGFHLWMSTSANGPYSQVASFGINARNGTVGGLARRTTYYFRVSAYNLSGESTQSPSTGGVAGTTL